MSAIRPVDLDVLSIGPGDKSGVYHFVVQFHSSPEKNYDYYRAAKKQPNEAPRMYVVIAGVRIIFSPYSYEVIRLEREYDTKGVIRSKATEVKKKPKDIWEELKKWKPEEKQEEWAEEKEEVKWSEEDTEVKEEPKEEEVKEELPILEATTPKVEEEPVVEVPRKVKHEKYEQIKTCLDCDIPVYLAGPAGSGKNHTVEQIAKEMGWNFYFSNSIQQEYKLTGFIDAGGNYHETEFYKALTDEEECVFFLDEIDASIPEVLVLLNAAIANGYFEFPNGRVDFDHVHFVAAGNTVGSGADDLYTGRMVLDQATLDRFAIIKFDYDKNVELKLARGNKELVDFIRSVREYAEKNGIRATFSYRCISMATKLEKAGMELKEILTITVFKGMDKDTINSIKPMGLFGNKYMDKFHELQRGW